MQLLAELACRLASFSRVNILLQPLRHGNFLGEAGAFVFLMPPAALGRFLTGFPGAAQAVAWALRVDLDFCFMFVVLTNRGLKIWESRAPRRDAGDC
jgi:hypothetical protein